MRILHQAFRIYGDPDSLDRVVALYEQAPQNKCERRIEVRETGVTAAKVWRLLDSVGQQERLAAVNHVHAIFYVDSLDEFSIWLDRNAAERRNGPRVVNGGRNATFRHPPDGLVVEYFEPSSNEKLQTESLATTDLVQYLTDRQSIQDTISRYSLGQDSHQGADSGILEQWDETFGDDGKVDYSAAGGPVATYRDLARWLRGDEYQAGSMSRFSNWQHMLSLPIVTLSGDRARARTDFFATHCGRADQGSNIHFNAAGAFHDELIRTPKGWRIAFRRLEVYFGDAMVIAS